MRTTSVSSVSTSRICHGDCYLERQQPFAGGLTTLIEGLELTLGTDTGRPVERCIDEVR